MFIHLVNTEHIVCVPEELTVSRRERDKMGRHDRKPVPGCSGSWPGWRQGQPPNPSRVTMGV